MRPSPSTITLALAFAAYLGCYALPPEHRPAGYYVATGALTARLAWCWRRHAAAQGDLLALFTATWVLIESSAQAGCGAAAWWASVVPDGSDLCLAVGLGDMLTALAALVLAALITWRRRLWPTP